MSDGPPVSQHVNPVESERQPPSAFPLGAEFIALTSANAALILAGSVAFARADLSPEDAAKLAVQLSVGIANEVRQYRLMDGRAVRMEEPSA